MANALGYTNRILEFHVSPPDTPEVDRYCGIEAELPMGEWSIHVDGRNAIDKAVNGYIYMIMVDLRELERHMERKNA